MLAIVTATYASLLALILCGLAIHIIKIRRREGIGLNHGGNASLDQAMRLQANFVEYTPLFLILLLVLELNQASSGLLHLFGTVFLVSRLLHIYGFGQKSGYSHGRFVGTLATLLTLVAMALTNVLLLFKIL